MFNEKEVFFQCPYCAQRISFLCEEIHGSQQYIEDCEVCCQPILMHFVVEDGEIVSFSVERSD